MQEQISSIAEPHFCGLDPVLPVRIYRRDLPHWRQDGATYFVTFRLADSIPARILAQWMEERRLWLAAHGLSNGIRDEDWSRNYWLISEAERLAFERTNSRRIFEETDKGHGACVLRQAAMQEILVSALNFFHGTRCWTGDFVVMPNHVHWLAQPFHEQNLEGILNSVKRFAATQASQRKLHSGKFWQRESHDHLVRDRDELARIRKYIRENPERAELKNGEYSLFKADWLDG